MFEGKIVEYKEKDMCRVILNDLGERIVYGRYNFATYDEVNRQYFLTPNYDRLALDWQLVLFDREKKTIYYFEIPANTFDKSYFEETDQQYGPRFNLYICQDGELFMAEIRSRQELVGFGPYLKKVVYLVGKEEK